MYSHHRFKIPAQLSMGAYFGMLDVKGSGHDVSLSIYSVSSQEMQLQQVQINVLLLALHSF